LPQGLVRERAEQLAERLKPYPEITVSVAEGESVLGGGAAPSAAIPTTLVALAILRLSADELLRRLRSAAPPIIARIHEDQVVIDLRTVFPQQDEIIAETLLGIAKGAH
jgi:L-seryl-tRNA(Ser) seleniumtransferase